MTNRKPGGAILLTATLWLGSRCVGVVSDLGPADGGEHQPTCQCPLHEATCEGSRRVAPVSARCLEDGGCEFLRQETFCDRGCDGGLCLGEPCQGVVCSQPPPAECVNSTTLRVYPATGACQDGRCHYAGTDLSCPCANGRCQDNPCTGKICVSPPPAACDGGVLRTYASPGACDAATGGCVYAPVDTACGAGGCRDAQCLADQCAGVNCDWPPASTCVDTTTARTWSAPGKCDSSTGVCSYQSQTITCPAGQQCSLGVCQCTPTTCAAQGQTCGPLSDGCGGLLDCGPCDGGTTAWAATGALGTTRWLHSATLLLSGKVLVAGGTSAGGVLADAQLYEPTQEAWSRAGTMATPRAYHTATLLPSGKVLVAGGDSTVAGSGHTKAVEVYDPLSGSWSAAAPMTTARRLHTATLLQSGKVLVAGGYDSNLATSAAELYDPATGMWTATGSMGTPRAFHTATLLQTGEVLVVGGFPGTGRVLSTAERYDPASGTWRGAGTMGNPRYYHVAIPLPSGKVLVAGGNLDGANTIAAAELFDPASGTWTATGSMTAARRWHTATLLVSGRVLVAGGAPTGGLSNAELYDPSSGAWSTTAAMASDRWHHTATRLSSGRVMVAGGANSMVGGLSSAEIY